MYVCMYDALAYWLTYSRPCSSRVQLVVELSKERSYQLTELCRTCLPKELMHSGCVCTCISTFLSSLSRSLLVSHPILTWTSLANFNAIWRKKQGPEKQLQSGGRRGMPMQRARYPMNVFRMRWELWLAFAFRKVKFPLFSFVGNLQPHPSISCS